jgi:hypothetical protein
MGIKNGKLLTSHRSTIYPCCLPALGEFNRSWSYKTCRGKDRVFVFSAKFYVCMVVFQILAGLFWFDAKYCLPIADVFAGFTAAHELKFIFTTAKLQNHYLVVQ